MRTIDRLRFYDLVNVVKTLHGSRLPLHTWITSSGQECVEEHNGDIGAYLGARQSASTTTYNNTITMGDYGQASAFTSGDVSQNISQITVDPERLRDVARAAQEVLPLLPEHMHSELRHAAEDVTRAADDLDDSSRLWIAGQRLATVLGPASALFTVVRFIIDALSGGLGH